ncbi:MAG: hypothetical protein OXJ90_01600, partial [Spirochaetaceae bacterium]|nr:hypothetical protein [Spirochaetaceae bacterium]
MSNASMTSPLTAVAGLPDDQLLAQTGTLAQLDRQLQVFVIDHLLEIEARALHLRRGFSSLFDYVKHGLGYSDGATYRRIGAMKLCAQVAGTRERLRDGSLTLDAAAQLQSAFDRRDRQQGRAARGAPATSTGPAPKAVVAAGPARQPSGSPPAAPAKAPPPELDLSARKALVDEAVGKSSREVMRMLAGVDPDLAAPADRLRPLDAERWELKTVIDTECQRGLEQLKGLLSHVDPHMTIGQLVGRLVKEGLDRHDPARPPRRARRPAGSRSAGDERTPAPKQEARPAGDADPARSRSAIHARDAASPAKPQTASAGNSTSAPEPRDTPAHAPSLARRPDKPAGSPAPAPKPLRDSEAPAPSSSERSARPAGVIASAVTPPPLGQGDPGGGAGRANLRLLCGDPHRHRHAEHRLARQPAGGSSMTVKRSPPAGSDRRWHGRNTDAG